MIKIFYNIRGLTRINEKKFIRNILSIYKNNPKYISSSKYKTIVKPIKTGDYENINKKNNDSFNKINSEVNLNLKTNSENTSEKSEDLKTKQFFLDF